eukprot:scaffold20004_cov122-Amphora_coffeaeformis.AAC.2
MWGSGQVPDYDHFGHNLDGLRWIHRQPSSEKKKREKEEPPIAELPQGVIKLSRCSLYKCISD